MTAAGIPATVRANERSELSCIVRDAGARAGADLCSADGAVHRRVIGCWVAFVPIGDSWYQAIVVAALGVVSTLVGFLGHDSGLGQPLRRTAPKSAPG